MIQRMYPEAVARRQKEQELERKLKQDKLTLEATNHLQQILLPGNLRPSSSSLTQVKKTPVSKSCLQKVLIKKNAITWRQKPNLDNL